MEMNKKQLTKKTVMIVTLGAFAVIVLVLTAITFLINDRDDSSPSYSSNQSHISDSISEAVVSETESYNDEPLSDIEASQTFAESSVPNESVYEDPSSGSDDVEKSVQGWVINEYGYTYVYKDSGYEQFYFGMSTLERYADSVNSVVDKFPESTRIFNITVPVSATFADIPYEIRNRDDYFNSYQSTFVSTVATKLDSRIQNIPIITLIEQKYNDGEYIFYRTDRNWTQNGAYFAYTAFCEKAGLKAYSLDNFEKKSEQEFLGSFYIATQSTAMEKNPDTLVCYSTIPSVKTVMTVYDSGFVYENFTLCSNKVSKYDAYDIYLGKTAERYEINTTVAGGNLLIIGDSSVYPMVPFLASHYNKIDVINPEYFGSSLEEFLANRKYDDVITMCYSTNAVNGGYVPAFNTMTGVTTDE